MPKTNTVIKVGDRVADRPKNNQLYSIRSEMKEVAAKNSTQRYGVVVECATKKNARGQEIKYCSVLWDGFSTPSSHAQSRLCLIEDYDEVVKSFMNAIG